MLGERGGTDRNAAQELQEHDPHGLAVSAGVPQMAGSPGAWDARFARRVQHSFRAPNRGGLPCTAPGSRARSQRDNRPLGPLLLARPAPSEKKMEKGIVDAAATAPTYQIFFIR